MVYDQNFREAGVDTVCTLSPTNNFYPLPTPYFKMFLERFLNDSSPPHFKHLSLLHPPPPPSSNTPATPTNKNFDHTHVSNPKAVILHKRKFSFTAKNPRGGTQHFGIRGRQSDIFGYLFFPNPDIFGSVILEKSV